MKKVVFMTAFCCLTASLKILANDLDATVFNCNAIHTKANLTSVNQSYVYVLEALTDVGLWSSVEKITIKNNVSEANFSNLPNGVYRIACVLSTRSLELSTIVKTVITSEPLTIAECPNSDKQQSFSNTYQQAQDKDVIIYPNPASTHIQVSVKKGLILPESVITIRNITGQIVMQESLSNQLSMLNVSDLTNGIYYLSVSNGASPLYNDKFLIQRN